MMVLALLLALAPQQQSPAPQDDPDFRDGKDKSVDEGYLRLPRGRADAPAPPPTPPAAPQPTLRPLPQESPPPAQDEPRAAMPHGAGIGPDLAWWMTRLHGHVQADAGSVPGTSIDLRKDLNLPLDRGIPIYGGGSIYVPLSTDPHEHAELILSAEYWTRQWWGSTPLAGDIVFGDATYKSGTTVKSRFQLDSLDLGVTGRLEDLATRLQGALTLLLQGTEGRLRMQSAATTHQEKFGDLTWGLGLAGEWRPLDFFLAGLSLKGTINFGDTANTYEADLRGYVGAEWKYFRLEGGYRYMPYQEGHASSNSMKFDLYGSYVSLSIIFRV